LENLLKKSVIIGLILTLFVAGFVGTTEQAHAKTNLGLDAEAVILVDADTGKILYQKNPDKMLLPASMTKMMSEYLILEAIEEGKIDWDSEVNISESISDLSHNRNLSNVDLRVDAEPKYTVRELFEAAAIYSANAATMALAEKIAGSETEFVNMMNEKAEELGLEDYQFYNSTGLNNQDLAGQHPAGDADDMNVMSARATAKLAFHLLKDYPQVLETASIPTKNFRDGTEDQIPMVNWNWMIPGVTQAHTYEGVDGLKTGSTDVAGASFTGTAEKNGIRLISVIMKTNDRDQRFIDTAKLLDYGFNNFVTEEIVEAGFEPKDQSTLPVVKGKEKEIRIATSEPISTVIKKGEEDKYKPKVNYEEEVLNEEGALTAPIEEGQAVGTISLEYTGEEDFGYLVDNGNAQTPLLTMGSVEKANWFTLTMRGIGSFFANVWITVTDTVKGWF
jgi:D-alanyl-D-alanine carboxypeptidase (penicillin-binding protein 5/6)